MKKTIDISKYIDADAPEIVLFGKTHTVKNDKTTILLLNELQRKSEEDIKNGKESGIDVDEKILSLLLGKEAAKEVLEVINNSANYVKNEKKLLLNVLALATGQEYEELAKQVEKNTP